MFAGLTVKCPAAWYCTSAARHLEALQVQQEHTRQAAQHVVDLVQHGAAPAALACLRHLLVLRIEQFSRHSIVFEAVVTNGGDLAAFCCGLDGSVLSAAPPEPVSCEFTIGHGSC